MVFCLSSSWFKKWEAFVLNQCHEAPGAIDNRSIITVRNGAASFRSNSDYVQISEATWLLFHTVYGGGPEVVMKPNGQVAVGLPAAKALLPSNNHSAR